MEHLVYSSLLLWTFEWYPPTLFLRYMWIHAMVQKEPWLQLDWRVSAYILLCCQVSSWVILVQTRSLTYLTLSSGVVAVLLGFILFGCHSVRTHLQLVKWWFERFGPCFSASTELSSCRLIGISAKHNFLNAWVLLLCLYVTQHRPWLRWPGNMQHRVERYLGQKLSYLHLGLPAVLGLAALTSQQIWLPLWRK